MHFDELVFIRTLCDGYYKNLASRKDFDPAQLISKHLQVFLLFPDSKVIATLVN